MPKNDCSAVQKDEKSCTIAFAQFQKEKSHEHIRLVSASVLKIELKIIVQDLPHVDKKMEKGVF